MEPFVPSFGTNNFIQNTLSRLCAFDDTIKRWRPLRVDELGNVKLSVNIENAAAMRIADRETKTAKLVDAVSVPSLGAVTHAALDVDGFSSKTIMVNTNANCTVYTQVSNDGIAWYDVKTTADADWVFNCNNESISFEFIDVCKYMRAVVYNAAAGAAVVTVEFHGVV